MLSKEERQAYETIINELRAIRKILEEDNDNKIGGSRE